MDTMKNTKSIFPDKWHFTIIKWFYVGTTIGYLFKTYEAFFQKNYNDMTYFGLSTLSHACLCIVFFILHARIVKTP